MSEENTGVETPPTPDNTTEEPSLADKTWDKDTPTVDKVRIERDRIKAEARELKAKLAEFQEKERALEESKAMSENNWKKVLELREQKLTEAQKELEGLRQEKEKMVRKDREAALLESVAEKTGVQDRRLMRALLREASEAEGIDLAPENVEEHNIELAVAAITKMFPGALQNRQSPPGAPGENLGRLDPAERPATSDAERVAKLAQSRGGLTGITAGRRPFRRN